MDTFASNMGLKNLREHVAKNSEKYPALATFVTNGWSDQPASVRDEAAECAEDADDDVGDSLRAMADAIGDEEGVVVITDGVA